MLQINYRDASSYVVAGGAAPTLVPRLTPPTIAPPPLKLISTTPPPPPLLMESVDDLTLPLFDSAALRDDLQVNSKIPFETKAYF